MTRRVAGSLLWILLLLTAGVPLAWLIANLFAHPAAWADGPPGAHHLAVFLRTLLLAAFSAAGATLLAIAPAAVLAGRGWGRWLLWPVMAGLVVIPSPAWAYGWAEFLRQALGVAPPQSYADLARVVLTNATAFWPIPATAIALAWRRLPAGVLDAATLDGARRRVTIRLLAGPALAGWTAALLLASQNLAAPDLSGVVVASVVVRDAFQLGAGDQASRLATATALGLPSFLATAALALGGWTLFRRSIDWSWTDDDQASTGPLAPSFTVRARRRTHAGEGLALVATLLIVAATLLPSVVALARTAVPPEARATTLAVSPSRSLVVTAFEAHGPALVYGLQLAAASAGACLIAGLLATLARARGATILSVAAFLLGGQFLALGMIRAFNPPEGVPQLMAGVLGAIYDTSVYYAAANIALFAWIVLGAAGTTWHGRWRSLRDMAATDGAGSVQTAVHVLWPLAWPGLLAAGLAVLALSLTETQAAALMVPGTPMNFMLSNLHTLNYSAMAEASLLTAVVCGGGTFVGVGLWASWKGLVERRVERPVGRDARASLRTLLSLVFLISLLSVSCDRPPAPEAVWALSGSGDGQLAYPRAIAYSPADDTVWVVDKNARVQHFDSDGTFIAGWLMPDFKYGKPVGLSTDSEGNLWVADTHYYRVIVYRPDGSEWFRFGEQGTGPGQFGWPTDVLVLEDGRVLVSEYGGVEGESGTNDRIQIFQRSTDGTITDAPRQVIGQIGSFGTGEGQFRRPQSMAMVGDVLWVTDGANHRLQAFDLDGRLLKTLGGEPGSGPGEFRFPYGLAVDNDGNLLVSEFGNHRVQKIDPETGEALAMWGGGFGGQPGQVKYPWGLAYDSTRDRVILLDSGNDRMQVVRVVE